MRSEAHLGVQKVEGCRSEKLLSTLPFKLSQIARKHLFEIFFSKQYFSLLSPLINFTTFFEKSVDNVLEKLGSIRPFPPPLDNH